MSEFIQDHEQLASVMDSKVDPFILRGLQGESHHVSFGNVTEGSQTLNAFTRACRELRLHPNTKLTNEVIEIDEPLSTVGRYLVQLVNNSLERDADEQFNFASRAKLRGKDACHEAEENFYSAMGHEGSYEIYPEHRRAKNEIFADDEGTAVFFKKAYGERTALTLEDITLNKVFYPSGTLFQIGRKNFAPHNNYTENLQVHALEDITSLAPIRMTKFGVPLGEQLPLTATDPEDVELLQHCGVGLTMTLHDLKKSIPSTEELADLVGELPQPERYESPVWIPKPAPAT